MLKLVFAILVLASTTATAAPSMKGWELYSWSDKTCSDKVCFALVVGTNRIKSEAEIKRTPLSLHLLEAKLAKLGKGEEVFWNASSASFLLPDAKRPATDPLQRARKAIEKLGLKLTISGA